MAWSLVGELYCVGVVHSASSFIFCRSIAGSIISSEFHEIYIWTYTAYSCLVHECPGFSWDRVNFYRNLGGGGHSRGSWPELAKELFHTMWHHAQYIKGGLDFRWGLSVGGSGGASGPRWWAVALCITGFVYSFISTVVVVVISLCCSSKLPLSQPSRFQGFFSFLSSISPLSHRRGAGGVSEQPRGPLLPAGLKPRHWWSQ